MTDSELVKIEAALGITLCDDYRQLMRHRAKELKGLTYKVRDEVYGWFDFLLFLEAEKVIRVNLQERDVDSGTADAFPEWWKSYFLIGTNGAGDFFCLRHIGDQKVWSIGTDGGGPMAMYDSLSDFVDAKVRLYEKETPWQPPPVLSSFDNSCPLMDRFSVFISSRLADIKCQEGDHPVTVKKLAKHGIDANVLSHHVVAIVSVLSGCNPETIIVQRVSENRSKYVRSALCIKFGDVKIRDDRFCTVVANIFKGKIYLSLHGPDGPTPPPDEVGIDWQAFREHVARLLQAIHPPGTVVEVSLIKPPQPSALRQQWNYELGYTLM
jgi:hypothetical protein